MYEFTNEKHKDATYQPLEKVYVYCNTATFVRPMKKEKRKDICFLLSRYLYDRLLFPSFTKARVKLGKSYPPAIPKIHGMPENRASPSFQNLGETWGFHCKLGITQKFMDVI